MRSYQTAARLSTVSTLRPAMHLPKTQVSAFHTSRKSNKQVPKQRSAQTRRKAQDITAQRQPSAANQRSTTASKPNPFGGKSPLRPPRSAKPLTTAKQSSDETEAVPQNKPLKMNFKPDQLKAPNRRLEADTGHNKDTNIPRTTDLKHFAQLYRKQHKNHKAYMDGKMEDTVDLVIARSTPLRWYEKYWRVQFRIWIENTYLGSRGDQRRRLARLINQHNEEMKSKDRHWKTMSIWQSPEARKFKLRYRDAPIFAALTLLVGAYLIYQKLTGQDFGSAGPEDYHDSAIEARKRDTWAALSNPTARSKPG